MDELFVDEFEVECDYALEQLGCTVFPSLILCSKIRMFVAERGVYPRLDELVVYQYEPCDSSCQHQVPVADMVNIQTHYVIEYGTFLMTCDQLYSMYSYVNQHGRYPRYGENSDEDEEETEVETETFTEWMHNDIDRMWDHRQSGISIDSLVSLSLEQTLPDQCIFCQDELQKDQLVVRLPCTHVFHDTQECQGIKQWLIKINACPLCRTGI